MRLLFYLIVAFLLLACAGDAEGNESQEAAQAFPVVVGGVPWVEPQAGEMAHRWAQHLETNSREGLRFALQQFDGMGPEATSVLEPRIRELLQQPSMYPALHNMVEALGRAQAVDAEPLLLDILDSSSIPLVRSVAMQALVQIGAGSSTHAMILHLEHEIEAGPLFAGWKAVGELGGPTAAQALEEKFKLWMAGDPDWSKLGTLVWQGLLALQDEESPDRLARLVVGLAPIFRAQALRRRAELGDPRIAAEIALLLSDPGAGELVREECIFGLSSAREFEVLLGFPPHGPFRETSAVIQGFRHAHRQGLSIGGDWLQEASRHPDPKLGLQALQALCERGDRRLLDPWIRLAGQYPLAEGSSQALHVLRYPGVGDHLLPGILADRWRFCDLAQQQDVLRLLGQAPDGGGLSLLTQILGEDELDPAIKRQAFVQLGNVGPSALPLLNSYLVAKPVTEEADVLIAALSRMALTDPAARERLQEIAVNPVVGELCQRFALDALPRILGADSLVILKQARDQARNGRVLAYVDWLLRTYF